MTIWLYHINPKNRYRYGWDVKRPETLLKSSDRTWGAGTMFKKVQPGDMICVYMKNIAPNPDGVYVVGKVRRVGLEGGVSFSWTVDRDMSAKVVVSPIPTSVLRRVFPRIYGGSMQPLDEKHRTKWLSMLGLGNRVFRDTPVIKTARSSTKSIMRKSRSDPLVSRENGIKGERHILALLKQEFPLKDGYRVEHVAAKHPGSDHDISVSRSRTVIHLVEVKTRVGKPPDPVIISERELDCRKRHRGEHLIFIVYLNDSGEVHLTLEIGRTDTFEISPRQHWLHPNPL